MHFTPPLSKNERPMRDAEDPSFPMRIAVILRALACVLLISFAWASATVAQEDADQSADAAEEPSYPAGLDNPDMALDEFKLRLIPLTVSELEALAVDWQSIVRARTEAVIEANIEVMNATGAAADTAQNRVLELSEIRAATFDSYSAVVDSLELKGGDPALIAVYRAYRSSIVVEEAQQASVGTLVKYALSWITDPDGGIALAVNVIVIVIAFFGLLIAARLVRGYARRVIGRVPDLSLLLKAFFATVLYWLTLTIGLMVVLSALGVDITPIFALVGGASFIIAFAMQDTLGNLAAGLMIMFNRPFDEGDYISAAGTAGTVSSVSIVSTTVKTPDNQVIVIPNSKVWGDVISNATASAQRRVDLVFGIDYGDDPDVAAGIILETAKADPRVLSDPEPWVRVTNLGDSSVDLTARIWCRAEDFWELKFALTKEVKLAFDRGGISIPYPHQVEIHRQDG